jgi:hypothetical protein
VAPPPGTNGLAIAALVTGILGTLCFSSFVLAIAALVQVSRTGQKGRGLAIASLVLSTLWVAGGVTVTAVSVYADQHARHDTAAALAQSEDVSTYDIAVGDCLVTDQIADNEDPIDTLPRVPCKKRHDTEVYSIVQASGDKYPGDTEMMKTADDLCDQEFDRVLPQKVVENDSYGVFDLYPTADSWSQDDDRAITCMVTTSDLRTGSLRK